MRLSWIGRQQVPADAQTRTWELWASYAPLVQSGLQSAFSDKLPASGLTRKLHFDGKLYRKRQTINCRLAV